MNGRRRLRAVVAAGFGFAVAIVCATGAHAAPKRIVSLNLCTDQLVVDLVPAERIAAVTELATDPLSTPVPDRARGLPVTSASAEDVIGRRADLVLASPFTQPATLDLLRRTGHEVVTIGAAQSLEGVRDSIRRVARAVGAEARGEQLLADIDAALARNRPAGPARPSVVVLQPNNFASTGEGLVPELLALTGFRNHASRIGLGPSGRVEIETLVAHPPDVLILANAPGDYATVVADNLRHPALAALAARLPSAVIPWNGWLCGTHHIAGVLDQLGALRRQVIAAGGARD